MKNHYPLTLVFAIILVVGLSACEMKASTPPPLTEDTDQEIMDSMAETQIAKAGEADSQESEGGDEVAGSALGEKTMTPAVGSESDQATAAPTNTPVPAPTSTPVPVDSYPVPTSYTIHKGEHPYCLGRRFNINPDDLLAHNGLYRGSTLYPGQTLQIPSNARPFPGVRELKPHPTTYTVVANDTFYSIACKFGNVDPRAIAQHNGMGVSQGLSPGQSIAIP